MNRVSALTKEAPTELPGPSCHVRPGHDVYSLGEGPRQTMLTPWSLTFSLQHHEQEMPVVYKPPSLWGFVIAV